MRRPPRCLDCDHPVSAHRADLAWGLVGCLSCHQRDHYLSLAYDYPGTWVEPGGRPPRPRARDPRVRARRREWARRHGVVRPA